jgi:hypothetical protein
LFSLIPHFHDFSQILYPLHFSSHPNFPYYHKWSGKKLTKQQNMH